MNTAERRDDGLGWFGWLVAVAGSGWALLVVAATWYLGQRESVEARCTFGHEGPDMAAYTAAGVVPEAIHPNGSFGWFPLGWTCRWDLGSAVYIYAPDWGATLFDVPGILVALIPGVFWLTRRRRWG